MYVCTNCGKEYASEASFCASCGGKVVAFEAPQAPAQAPANALKTGEPFIVTLMGFLAKVVQIITVFFAAVAMATPYIYVRIKTSSYSVYATTTFQPDETCSVFALLFALAGMGLAVVSFIFALKNGADLKTKFSKITGLTSALLLFILSIVLLSA